MTDHTLVEVGDLPPEDTHRRGRPTLAAKYAAELETVRSKPGRWFRLADFTDKASPHSSAYSFRRGLEQRTTGFKIVCRGGCVYIRAEEAS